MSSLPFHNKTSSLSPGRQPSTPRVFCAGSPVRIKEKYLVLCGCALFVMICYSSFVLLPSDRPTVRDSIRRVFHAPPQLVIPPPKNYDGVHRHDDGADDPHARLDEQNLRRKIDDAQIPKPQQMPDQPPPIAPGGTNSDVAVVPKHGDRPSYMGANEKPLDTETKTKQTFIVDMMKHAWDGYAKYAWGANEVKPNSKTGHGASIFGQSGIGATIIDALDTLYVMGLTDRYEKGAKYVEMSLNWDDIRGELSVFETNIRFVGGLLTMHALTQDKMYLTKAKGIVDLLLPVFDTPTGIPMGLFNSRSKSSHNWGWASGGASILSEFGTLHLEFEYLSDMTGDRKYYDKVMKIRNFLDEIEKPNGLYYNYLNPKTGKWGARSVAMGALGDSFYEYLIKSWLATGKRDVQAKRMYDETIEAMERDMKIVSPGGLTYFGEIKGSRVDNKFDHLGCFCGGMFALQSVHETDPEKQKHFLELGKAIGHTCHESYVRSDSGIGPEAFRFTSGNEAKAINDREKFYILRPEVIETWFYLWRVTKDPMYRQWAWDAAQAIEKHCKGEAGYSGLRNVYSSSPQQDDVQQSFFLAETLKYLYLIFSDDSVLPLDDWVFNTEAHPLPIRKNAGEVLGLVAHVRPE